MFKTIDELFNYISENNIKTIDLKIVDLPGRWHHVTIPASTFSKEIFKNGVGVDASSLSNFKGVECGDMIIIPDITTAIIDPFWQQPTLSMICDIFEADTKKEFILDPRNIAKKAENFLKKQDYANSILMSPEYEFHIFDSVEYENTSHYSYYTIDSEEAEWNSGENITGKNLGNKIRKQGGYHATPPLDVHFNLRNEVVNRLEDANIKVKYHHHEVGGPGQSEIEVLFYNLLKSADNTMTVKYIIKNTAKYHGKTATFMPKPLYDDAGNGMHVHMMLRKNNEPVFYEKGKYADLSQTALYFIGGILHHGRSLAAFTNPSTNSYKRLMPGYEAPVNLFFSLGNRSAAIRIPKYATQPDKKRFEFRSGDGTCNIYFMLSALLMAGHDGVANKIDPKKYGYGPYDMNIFKNNDLNLKSMPTSLKEALDALNEDHDYLLKGNVFSKELIDTWIDYKIKKEIEPMRSRPHPFEIELYYDM